MMLVINPGSSSLKWALFDTQVLEDMHYPPVKAGAYKGIGTGENYPTHADALRAAVKEVEPYLPITKSIVYRVVHGGHRFLSPAFLNNQVIRALQDSIGMAPLHLPIAIGLIRAGKKIFPHLHQIAVFDTSFFRHLPPEAQQLPLSRVLTQKYHLRRYGFHGFSHRAAARAALEFFKKRHPRANNKALKIITVHLGQGISVTALSRMQPQDTSMGFTPNDGVPMLTRSGALDVGLVRFLFHKLGPRVFSLLEQNAGIAAVAGMHPDFRDILWAAAYPVTDKTWIPPHMRITALQRNWARLSVTILVRSLVKTIGGYAALLGGLDVLVFTGSIGAESHWVRETITSHLKGIGSFYTTTAFGNEEWEMALDAREILKNSQ